MTNIYEIKLYPRQYLVDRPRLFLRLAYRYSPKEYLSHIWVMGVWNWNQYIIFKLDVHEVFSSNLYRVPYRYVPDRTEVAFFSIVYHGRERLFFLMNEVFTTEITDIIDLYQVITRDDIEK